MTSIYTYTAPARICTPLTVSFLCCLFGERSERDTIGVGGGGGGQQIEIRYIWHVPDTTVAWAGVMLCGRSYITREELSIKPFL